MGLFSVDLGEGIKTSPWEEPVDMLLLIVIALWLSLAMALAWAIQRVSGLSGWIDTIWSFAVGVGGIMAALFAHGDFDRRVAILVIVAAWALRLGSHIGSPNQGSRRGSPLCEIHRRMG